MLAYFQIEPMTAMLKRNNIMGNILDQIAITIIREQELVIGPIAWSEASKVRGLHVQDKAVRITGKSKSVLEALVTQYARLFGKASIEVCKDATRPFLGKFPKSELPTSLQ